MPSGFHNWSQTAAANATADSAIGWAEGQAPSTVNDSSRASMAVLAKWRDDNNGSLTTGGTSTAYTLTTNTVFTSLALMDNQTLAFTMSATSGSTPTLNVDGLGAKFIRNATGVALPTGALLSGSVYKATYENSAGEWLLHNQPGVFPTSSVGTVSIADSAVTTAKIADGAVTGAKISGNFIPFSSGMSNGTIVESHVGNAITFTIKTLAGATPSASDSVKFYFRNVTVGTGDYSVVEVTSALSLTISAGSTVGFANATAARLWLLAINNAGTVELAAINCLSGTSIYRLNGWSIITTTAEGGSGAADSAHVPYSTAGRTSVAFVPLGYASWESGLTTAGTWNASPDRIQLCGPGVPLPGMEIQRLRTDTGALATGTTVIPRDDTIPQSTEGDQYMTRAITPTSACNLLNIIAQGLQSGAVGFCVGALFRDSEADAVAVAVQYISTSTGLTELKIDYAAMAGSASAITFKYRAGSDGGGTITFNGQSGGRLYGGVINSYMEARELMV